MAKPLRILILEDQAADAEIMVFELRQAGFDLEWQRVDTKADYVAGLSTQPDIILADYRLPQFDALKALELLKESGHDIPFIIVSGTIGEEIAVKAMKLGADDYLLKDRLARLGLAITQALEEKHLRDEKQRAEKALAYERDLLKALMDNIPEHIYFKDVEGRFTRINKAMAEYVGLEDPEEAVGKTNSDFFERETAEESYADEWSILEFRQPLVGKVQQVKTLTGRVSWVLATKVPIINDEGKITSVVGISTDITNLKQTEDELREQRAFAEALSGVASTVNSTLDYEEVISRILTVLETVVAHDGANIMLIDRVEGSIQITYSCDCYTKHGYPPPQLDFPFDLKDVPHLEKTVTSGQPLVIPDTRECPTWQIAPGTEWLRSYATAPIRIDNEVVGILNVDSAQPGFYTDVHASRLQAFADQAAIAIKNARLYMELETHNELLEQAVEDRTAELQYAKERIEAILNNSPDAISLLNSKGNFTTFNPTFNNMFRLDHDDDYYGKSPSILVEEEYAPAVQEALRQVVEMGVETRLEVLARRQDGSLFDADIALAPMQWESDAPNIICSIRDISSLKEVERLKDAFVSNVSHELRTPLTSFKFNFGLLRMRPENREVYLNRLEREVDRLGALIDDLLRLSRLDQGRVHLEITDVDLNTVAKEYVDDRTPFAESQELSLKFEEQPDLQSVQADQGLIGQVLSVLLTNAINYTPAGGQVIVKVHADWHEGEYRTGFSVSDNGPGISEKDMSHLFERFYRGSVGRDSGSPGTGLGLSIAHEIVELHGGQIEVESEGIPGKGTTFTVWLPSGET